MDIEIAGQLVTLLFERALFWPAAAVLAVADLHWGKTETFHRYGVPLPGGILEGDLARLDAALARTGARRLLVLGDLIHGPNALSTAVVERIAQWRAAWPHSMTLVAGNHDRGSAPGEAGVLPAAWRIDVMPVLHEGPFCFRHEPVAEPGHHVWCGHVHPNVRVGPGARLPCFHLRKGVGVLPAFSTFTGGPAVRLAPGERAFGVVGTRVVEVGSAKT